MKSFSKLFCNNLNLSNLKKVSNNFGNSSLFNTNKQIFYLNKIHYNRGYNATISIYPDNSLFDSNVMSSTETYDNDLNHFMATQTKLDAQSFNKKRDLECHVASHYDGVDYQMVDSCWGDGNYHLGYFPNLSLDIKENAKNYDLFDQAVHNLTKRMIQLGNINKNSDVIDFGCGRGQGTLEVAMLAGCKMTGIDIADINMKYCNIRKKQNPELKLDFIKASFTELPESIVNRKKKFTHVFSQQSLIHCHEFIDEILEQASEILKYSSDSKNNGKLVISDWLSLVKNTSSQVQKDVCERLELTYILTQDEYINKLKKHNFTIQYYEDLTAHAELSARCIAQKAKRLGYTDYYNIWNTTATFFANREIGVNLFIASKNPKKSFN